MKIQVKMNVGAVDYVIDVEDQSEMETLHKAIVLSNPPKKCDVCGNVENFKMDTNKDKEANVYVNISCENPACKAKAKLGQYKSGGYFWHKFEKYVRPNAQPAQNSNEPY